jgi:hypothetical protein
LIGFADSGSKRHRRMTDQAVFDFAWSDAKTG